MTTCLNCGQIFNGNYCPQCGQKAGTGRLSFTVLLSEAFHFLTHFEKGFFHTAWYFLVYPGKASIDYLHGKRKQFQKPVSYILILAGLYILVHNFIINHYHYHYNVINEKSGVIEFEEQSNIFLRTHFTPFILLIILISAVIIYFVLARRGFNFIEILALCLYGGGTYFFMLIVCDIILGFIFKVNTISMSVFVWQTSVSAFYNFWFSFDIFKRAHLPFLWVRLIITAILVSLFGWIVMNYLPMVWINR